MEVDDLHILLESNQQQQIEEIKKRFYEQLNSVREPWLLNGLFDCFLQTSSMRLVEILVGVREPHDKHLFDKLSDNLRGQYKLQALTLLGHVVRRHPTPTWLIKITQHPILKDLLKLLKTETDIVLLMSALLIVIILLPMIPSLMTPYLQEIFEVFSRLAAWNTNNPNKVPEENLLHLQVGLCELFHSLYGMYPCNFLFFLRQQYSQREHLDVFSHTIKPMVCSVRMHPLLVTASRDAETAFNRWKKMEDHDVIVECAKYVLDAARDDPGPLSSAIAVRSRSAMEHSLPHESPFQPSLPGGRSMAAELALTYSGASDVEWSPSHICGLNTPPPESTPTSIPQTPVSQNYVSSTTFPHQEGTSPPEAAIEATPETTPIKDHRHLMRQPPAPSNVMRALNHSLSSGSSNTGIGTVAQKWSGGLSVSATSYSQPSSPMKKEQSPFRYSGVNQQLTATPPPIFPAESVTPMSAFQQPRRDSLPMGGSALLDQNRWEPTSLTRRVANLVQERKQQVSSDSGSEKPSTSSVVKLRSNTLPSNSLSTKVPSSPLRVIPSSAGIPESPVPIEPTAPVPGSRDWPVTRPTPEKNGFKGDSMDVYRTSPYPHGMHHTDSTQEDQEIVEIVRQGEQFRECHSVNSQSGSQSVSRHCDSVLQEFPAIHSHDDELDGDECQQEASGSPCASGGLHMPNSVMNFTRRASRMRYFSQCLPSSVAHHVLSDTNIGSTGSSPGEGGAFPVSSRVRRANSCPEMEKAPVHLPGTDLKVENTVEEKEEFEESGEATTPQNSIGEEVLVNGCALSTKPEMKSEGTQTLDCAPYEHLFLSVFSPIDGLSSPIPSPAPMSVPGDFNMFQSKDTLSAQAQLDQYLVKVMDSRPKGQLTPDAENRLLREQILLLNFQLQFERQRREVHAERNRRLLGRCRNNRALEEHKTALKEQLSLVQKDLELLSIETTKEKQSAREKEQHLINLLKHWEYKFAEVEKNWLDSQAACESMTQDFFNEIDRTAAVQKDYQIVQAKLFDMGIEVQQAEATASLAERLRAEVNQLHREILLVGEQHQRFHDYMQHFSLSKNRSEEKAIMNEAFHTELNSLKQMLEVKNSALEAAKTRVAELEANVNSAVVHIGDKKRQLKVVKDEYNDQLQAVESKYQAQKKINQRLQEYNLELLNVISQLKCKRKREGRELSASQPSASTSCISHPKSPDSICSDDRLPHSNSPLSESLSSSEGMSLPGILAKDVSTLQNLQVIVDQPEQPADKGTSAGTTGSDHNPVDEG